MYTVQAPAAFQPHRVRFNRKNIQHTYDKERLEALILAVDEEATRHGSFVQGMRVGSHWYFQHELGAHQAIVSGIRKIADKLGIILVERSVAGLKASIRSG